MIGPVAGLITFLPIVTRVKIALNRLNEYENLLDANIKGKIMHGDMQDINSEFQQIEFRDVTYEYYDKEKEKIFSLGPLNVTISQGEKIFITGGNGSGKTTFVKLLTGLYKPVSGQILLNGHVISDKNLPYYRDQISAIFTDNYLFEENYNEFDLDKHNAKLSAYIEVMRLTDIIRTNETSYELTRSLSQGQRKRLAMIMALMEARQIIVLDEWAAEQDPQFRAYFYRKILPYLLDNNKTIIAITHDDNYYHLAGRIIKFDYGKIASDEVAKDEVFVLQVQD
jgi:putative ATP-binding cassette transporter